MPTLELITILPIDTPHIHVSHFVYTSFSDALVTFVSDQVTRPLQPMFSTGSEQQVQNIRVRTVFLTLTKILDSLVFFHQVCKKISSESSCKQVRVMIPLTPHFYIVKLGFIGVYLIFLFLL